MAKIRQIVAEGRDDRRAILQLGYNLGRLGELTRQGRGPFWDAWKDAVADWDESDSRPWPSDLLTETAGPRRGPGESPDARSRPPDDHGLDLVLGP